MITAVMFSDDHDINTFNGFQIIGHADFSKLGEPDIVCAAVSAISQTAYLGIKEFTYGGLDVIQEKGLFMVQSNPGSFYRDNPRDKAVIYMTMFFGLMEIAKQYPGHLQVIREYRLKSGEPVERVVAGGHSVIEGWEYEPETVQTKD